jgi:hypothetical protein
MLHHAFATAHSTQHLPAVLLALMSTEATDRICGVRMFAGEHVYQ